MSAKDFKARSPSRGGRRRRDANTAEEPPVRVPDAEGAAQAGLKIYRFDLSTAGGTDLLFDAMRRGKRL